MGDTRRPPGPPGADADTDADDMQIALAVLIALVILAFMSSRRAGMAALAAFAVLLAALGAWTVYDGHRKADLEAVIPLEDVEIGETRVRFGVTEYLVRNQHPEHTLAGFTTEHVARLPDGTIVDRKRFEHRVDIPPGQARWTPLRFPGLDGSLDYSREVVATVAAGT